MLIVPDYIAERIRRPVPDGCSVIPGSTPIVSFGNAETAWVATLGLNPSRREFSDAKRSWLTGDSRRLATLESLAITDLTRATDVQVARVAADCYAYFDRNPYAWFNDLQNLMQTAVGSSFYDGTACHLDLVQWATDAVWSQLSSAVRARVISHDREFLRQQFQWERVRLVLMNGRGVLDQIQAMGVTLDDHGKVALGSKSCSIKVGEAYGAVFIGWSANLQGSHGMSSDFKIAIAERVGEEAAAVGVRSSAINEPKSTFIPRGTALGSKSELAAVLSDWLSNSTSKTIGDAGTFGGKAWIRLDLHGTWVVLNADTKRQAVLDFLRHIQAKGAESSWSVIANAKGKFNRAVYATDESLPGWYCYVAKPWTGSGQL